MNFPSCLMLCSKRHVHSCCVRFFFGVYYFDVEFHGSSIMEPNDDQTDMRTACFNLMICDCNIQRNRHGNSPHFNWQPTMFLFCSDSGARETQPPIYLCCWFWFLSWSWNYRLIWGKWFRTSCTFNHTLIGYLLLQCEIDYHYYTARTISFNYSFIL